jgi:uncharacterized protein YndB with AHSA1/START domain
MPRSLVIVVTLFAARLAAGDVLDAAAAGFTIQHEAIVPADRALVWKAAIGEVQDWWNPDHTVANGRLSIEPTALGCFCERFAGSDAVAHLQVTAVSTGVMLRMTGGLGPLGLLGVSGNMTWEFFDSDLGTRVRFTYAVGGYRDGGLRELAGPVDDVIGDALRRLREHVEARDAG